MFNHEQIRALAALAKAGTFQAAAAEMGKSYTSVNYLLKTMEEQAGFPLLDRSAYRTKLNAKGRAILKLGKKLLDSQEELFRFCENLRTGWEPSLHLVYDGILDIRPVIGALNSIRKKGITTKITTTVAFHESVESEFLTQEAELMIAISPMKEANLPHYALGSFRIFLVASEKHALQRAGKKIPVSELREHTLVTVRGSSARLGLSTLELESNSEFIVSDFLSKKIVIEQGLGYGWLPEYLITKELKTGSLKKLPTEISNTHSFTPKLYHLATSSLGRASQMLMEALKEELCL